MLHVSLSDARFLETFCAFMRNARVEAVVDGGVVRLSAPGAVSELHERRELAGYVTTWNALNPHCQAETIE